MRKIRTNSILFFLSLLVGCQSTIEENDNHKQEAICSLEWFSTVQSNLPINLEKKSFDSTKYSTEGTQVDTYFSDDSLRKIEFIIYGETFKTQIEYVFSTPQDYVVYDTRYHYSSPISFENSQIMATSNTTFLVCNGKPQNVVDQVDIQKNVDNAEQLLKDILSKLSSRDQISRGISQLD